MPNINGSYIFLITFAILLVPFIIILKKKFVCCTDESPPHSNNPADGISSCPPENRTGEIVIGISDEVVKNSDCSICIAEIKIGEICAILHPCCHGFHVGCVRPWLEDNETCPLCRTTVNTNLSRVIRYRGNLAA
ncbi:hypothetical protein R3W88_009804 [Solanum pinnatisectum]|uniref:RING-type domain-containing protein n=1 Tax=Solanum pinnatisectum TaxID=50273 RepID=A0AAV9MCR2_9SOLN|nr:hypothetical protein R3W88_009804 [Solanum pinnatisectum]